MCLDPPPRDARPKSSLLYLPLSPPVVTFLHKGRKTERRGIHPSNLRPPPRFSRTLSPTGTSMTDDDQRAMIESLNQAYDEVGYLVKTGRVTLQEIAHTYATLAVAVACLRHDRR